MTPRKPEPCATCGGDGWTLEHASGCAGYHGAECDCGGEQVECPDCKGSGKKEK